MRATPRDWTLLVVLALMWGTAFLATDVAVRALTPATVVAARLTLGGVVLAALLRGLGVPWPRGAVWRFYAALGFFGNALPFLLITWGQQRVPSGLTSILVATMPLFTLPLASRVFEDERLTPRRALGVLVGFAGVVLLVGPEALRSVGGEASLLARQGAILLAACSYGVNALLARLAPPRPLLANTMGMVVCGALMTLPIAVFTVEAESARLSWEVGVAIAWLGLVSTAVASIVYLGLVRSAGASFFSLINYLVPLVAVAAGAVVLHEALSIRTLAALVVILSGLAVSEGRRAAPG